MSNKVEMEWIKYKEQKPKYRQVVIFGSVIAKTVGVGEIEFTDVLGDHLKVDNAFCSIEPTHWMPLPKLPEVKK